MAEQRAVAFRDIVGQGLVVRGRQRGDVKIGAYYLSNAACT